MSLFEPRTRAITSTISLTPGYFAAVSNMWLLPITEIAAGVPLRIQSVTNSPILNIYEASVDDEVVGYAFSSAFTVVNGGGYLLARMQTRAQPSEYLVMLRSPQLVIYNYPGVATLAVSLICSPQVTTILQEQ